MKRNHAPKTQDPGNDPSDTSHRRYFATLLKFWIACGEARCRRAQACMGDYDECFVRLWRHVPEDLKTRMRATARAVAEGKTWQEACRFADAEVARWKDIERGFAEKQNAAATAPAVSTEAAPAIVRSDRVRPGPRIRSV